MRTNPTPKHPGGRPTKFRPDICESVVKLMAEGRSLDGCATLLGVHPDSLYEWQRVHAEFSGAVRAGRTAATTFWEGRLLDIAKGGSGNAQAIQWALRNRSRASTGWNHAHSKVEVSGPDGGPVQQQVARTLDLTGLTDEELGVMEALLLKSATT